MTKMLSGRTALITGAGKNIGRSIALTLAEAGASVVVNGRSDAAALDEVVGTIRDAGGQAHAVLGDVTDDGVVPQLVSEAVDRFGGLDIVVSNAAMRSMKPVVEMPFSEWRNALAVTLDAAFLLAHHAGPHLMESPHGRFIGLGGVSHHAGAANRVHVNAAKAGMEGLCRGLAAEWAPSGTTANTISPGFIDTERGANAGAAPSGLLNLGIPLGRKGYVEEIAGAALYLCSDAAAYVTGHTLHVNGGRVMR